MERGTDTPRVRTWLRKFKLSPNSSRWSLASGEVDWGAEWGTIDLETWRTGSPMLLEVTEGPDGVDEVAAITQAFAGWLVRIDYARVDGEVVEREISFRPREMGDRAAGSRAMRRLGLGGVQDDARKLLADPWVGERLGTDWAQPQARPGRAGRDDVHYALWAALYVDAVEANPRTPVKHIIEEVRAGRLAVPGAEADRSVVTPAEVRWYLTEARTRKLLTAAPRGRSGGKLTAKARRLLDEFTAVTAEASVTTSEKPTSRTRKAK